MSEAKSEIGVFGLGVMGGALSLNFADKDFKVSVYNRDEGDEKGTVDRFISSNIQHVNLFGYTEISNFVQSLGTPRKVLVMVSASAIDSVIKDIIPILDQGDILIDAGNSHFKETKRRIDFCKTKGIEFVGIGVSGGEKGARNGPSIMPGGSKAAYEQIRTYLEAISARDRNGTPCISYIGPEGAGHFVKMVHNGIEYVEMQLLAELYQVLRNSKSNIQIAEIFDDWNQSDLQSYLLDITAKIFRKADGDQFLIDQILDKAGNKGTGNWGTVSALELGSDNSLMSSAVFARYISSFKRLRTFLHIEDSSNKKPIDLNILMNAYRCVRKLNHLQGFELIRVASQEYEWDINYAELSRIWTNGCIIRSKLMEDLSELFINCDSLVTNNSFINSVKKNESDISMMLHNSIANRTAIPSFSSAWNYWVSLTTSNGPANLIQAQRDFFGAHTYQRIDDSSGKSYHTNWEE